MGDEAERNFDDVISKIKAHMLLCGFTENTVITYWYLWREFRKYALSEGHIAFERQWLLDYVKSKLRCADAKRRSQGEYKRVRVADLLCDFLEFGRVKRHVKVIPNNPLHNKFKELVGLMDTMNYSFDSIKRYFNVGNRIAAYGADQGFATFSDEWVAICAPELFGIPQNEKMTDKQREKLRIAKVVCHFEEHGSIPRHTSLRQKEPLPAEYDSLFTAMESYCSERRVSKDCRRYFKGAVQSFAEYLNAGNVSVSQLSVNTARNYFLTNAHYAPTTKKLLHYILRHVLRKTYELGATGSDVSLACENIRTFADAKIPCTYSNVEIQAILNSVDRSASTGKRDYAVLLLAARYGIRAGDLRNLRFENLLWKTSEIRFFQSKTQNEITLPMSDEVGAAIIDYLKNGRPNSASKHIFTLHRAPYTALSDRNNLQMTLYKYLKLSGVGVKEGQRNGLHNFRHSLASNMLALGTPLPVISEVLGHTSTDSTGIYTKIDVTALRKCSLPTSFSQ
jgi:site-specific recombinase XerD